MFRFVVQVLLTVKIALSSVIEITKQNTYRIP